MKKADIREIESLADDAITAMRAARAATLEAKGALGTAPELLKAAMDKSVAAHEEAMKYASTLALKVQGVAVSSVQQALTMALKGVEAAKAAMDALKANSADAPTQQKAEKADDDAVTRLLDAKAAFQWSPEVAEVEATVDSMVWRALSQWSVRLVIGVVVILFSGYMIWKLFGDGPLLDRLAKTELARGLITCLVSAGTILIAVVLVFAGLFGPEGKDDDKKFARAKDVLTVLVGIFGTILGFYFATDKTGQKPALELSPIVALRSPDGTSARVAVTVTGGKPPYTYSLAFTDPPGIPAIKDQSSSNGRISQAVTNLTNTSAVSYTLTIEDDNKVRLEHKANDLEKIPKKE